MSEVAEAPWKDLRCPACGRVALEWLLRCDLPQSACLHTLHCTHCHHRFLLDDAEWQEGGVRQELERKVQGMLCPYCQACHLGVVFQCDLITGECFYRAQCQCCSRFLDIQNLQGS